MHRMTTFHIGTASSDIELHANRLVLILPKLDCTSIWDLNTSLWYRLSVDTAGSEDWKELIEKNLSEAAAACEIEHQDDVKVPQGGVNMLLTLRIHSCHF